MKDLANIHNQKVTYMHPTNNKFNFILGPASIQGSDEWLDFRKDKIGSSDVPIILGLSPFESPREFWNRRILGKSVEANYAMRRGASLESQARDILNRSSAQDYSPCVIQSSENPSLIASLDGLHVDYDGNVHIAEIKCPGSDTHALAKAGIIPEHYIPQLCHQCMVSGAKSCIYVSWDGLSDHVVKIAYTPDESMCQQIKDEIAKFLASIEEFNMPEPQGRDWVECSDVSLVQYAERYKHLCYQISEREKEKSFLREMITSKMEHAKTIVNGLKIQKTYRNGSIDYSQIPELENVDLEKYREEPTESWRISIE